MCPAAYLKTGMTELESNPEQCEKFISNQFKKAAPRSVHAMAVLGDASRASACLVHFSVLGLDTTWFSHCVPCVPESGC